jgi:hypothetical protein
MLNTVKLEFFIFYIIILDFPQETYISINIS